MSTKTKSSRIYIIVISALLLTAYNFLAFREIANEPATAFVETLSPDQRERAVLAFDDTTKTRWHYFPSSMFQRPGVEVSELDGLQRDRLNALLQSFLSEAGYDKTQQIIDLENVLRAMSGDSVMRDPDRYSVVFYGNPATDQLWAWSFEGHHLSLNFTVRDGEISTAPRFFGANPATVPSGPRQGERALAVEEDLGFNLVRSMTAEQQELAVVSVKSPFDIASENAPEITPLAPEGIPYDHLNPDQQDQLQQLLAEYLSALPESLALERMAAIRAEELSGLLFAWAGATEPGVGHYYRIQGSSFLIEFDNTQTNANHIHTVWRDFDGDFGKDLIREHYRHAEHHRK